MARVMVWVISPLQARVMVWVISLLQARAMVWVISPLQARVTTAGCMGLSHHCRLGLWYLTTGRVSHHCRLGLPLVWG